MKQIETLSYDKILTYLCAENRKEEEFVDTSGNVLEVLLRFPFCSKSKTVEVESLTKVRNKTCCLVNKTVRKLRFAVLLS